MKPLKLLALVLLAVFACGQPSAPSDASPITSDVAPSIEASGPNQDDLPFSRKPHPASTTTPAPPDTRSHDEIRIAACSGAPDTDHPDGWRCAGKRPITFKAVGSTPITPVSWTVPAWFVDPQNTSTTAKDTNDCITSATACVHWSEIAVHRLGFSGVCAAPILRQNTSVTYLSSHTDNTDPMLFCPFMANGAVPSIVGTTPAAVAAVFTLNAAKNRAAGTNAMLSGSFSAGAPATGKLVQNTTALKGSRAFIYTTAGGANFNITQPVALQAIPQAAVPIEIDTWASLDTVNVLTPVAVNLSVFTPVFLDIDTAVFNRAGYLSQVTVFDPTGTGLDNVYLSSVWSEDVKFNRIVSSYGSTGAGITAVGFSPVFANCYFAGGIDWQSVQEPVFWAGAAPGTAGAVTTIISGIVTANTPGTNNQSPLVDGDFISGTPGGVFANATFGLVFMDNNIVVPQSSTLTFATGLGGSHVLYGTAAKTLTLQGNARAFMASGTFTAGWTAPTLVTGVTINGGTTASCNTGADPGVIHNATTTVSHLDAACGAGTGLGGAAFVLGGGQISNAL